MRIPYAKEESCDSASFTNFPISSSLCDVPVMLLIAASAKLLKLNPNIFDNDPFLSFLSSAS